MAMFNSRLCFAIALVLVLFQSSVEHPIKFEESSPTPKARDSGSRMFAGKVSKVEDVPVPPGKGDEPILKPTIPKETETPAVTKMITERATQRIDVDSKQKTSLVEDSKESKVQESAKAADKDRIVFDVDRPSKAQSTEKPENDGLTVYYLIQVPNASCPPGKQETHSKDCRPRE